MNELTIGRFEAACSHFEILKLEIDEYRLSGSDIGHSECEFKVFSHCRYHPRSKLQFESLGSFIKCLRAIALASSLINIGNLKSPPLASGII